MEEIKHKGYIIKTFEYIDKGNWAYSIYETNKGKWKRRRTMQHYITSEAAQKAAKNYINNHLKLIA